VTWFRIRRLLKPFDLQTLLFVFVFITVLFLVVYPIILVVMNSFQSSPPGVRESWLWTAGTPLYQSRACADLSTIL
jgi:ABC-type spermidine/putrescine transport system permease subunit II